MVAVAVTAVVVIAVVIIAVVVVGATVIVAVTVDAIAVIAGPADITGGLLTTKATDILDVNPRVGRQLGMAF